MTDIEITIPYTLTQDIYDIDEWGTKKLLFSKGDNVFGKDRGKHIAIRLKSGNLFISKNITIAPNLKCEGWEGPCENKNAWKGHMNTQYEHEESNYATLCPECWKVCNEHWTDMWADYYSNCM